MGTVEQTGRARYSQPVLGFDAAGERLLGTEHYEEWDPDDLWCSACQTHPAAAIPAFMPGDRAEWSQSVGDRGAAYGAITTIEGFGEGLPMVASTVITLAVDGGGEVKAMASALRLVSAAPHTCAPTAPASPR